jgi:hypothetical protein
MLQLHKDDFFSKRELDDGTMVMEIVLWWCVWGEAANLRFMPECISYIFYLAKNDVKDQPEKRRAEGTPSSFLYLIVEPLYLVLHTEMNLKNQFGERMPALFSLRPVLLCFLRLKEPVVFSRRSL